MGESRNNPDSDSNQFRAWPLLIVLSSMLLLYVSSRRTSSSGSNIPIPGVPSDEERLGAFGYKRNRDRFDDWDPETMGDIPPYPEGKEDKSKANKARKPRRPKSRTPEVLPDIPPEFLHPDP